MTTPHVLDDCRTKIANTFVGDWELPSGRVVRILLEYTYCCSCGKLYGVCPSENMVDVLCFCRKCWEKYGEEMISGYYVSSTEQFCQDVGNELMERFGYTPTDVEIFEFAKDHRLGPALEALMRDSPFPVPDDNGFGNRPKR
jgi:hypothetical protein